MQRPRALPDLGARYENTGATFRQGERGFRGEPHFSSSGEARTVKEEREADAPAHPPFAPTLQRSPPAFEAGARHCLAKDLERAAIGAQQLPRGGGIAGTQRVDLADANG